MNIASLTASPYRSLRAATVTNDPAGAVSGTVRRPNTSQAIRAPARAVPRMIDVTAHTGMANSSCSSPVTGASQSTMPPPR